MIHKLLTHKEAAKRLVISVPTFRKWVRSGFPVVDVGGKRTKILEQDVENIIKHREEQAELYGKIKLKI